MQPNPRRRAPFSIRPAASAALLAAALLASPPAPTAAKVPTAVPTVVFLGDSLTAGMGLEEADSFPSRVGELLTAAGRPVRVVNGGVSGDTSAGGLRRIDWLLRQKPAVVVVWLGANDGLRGFPVEETEKNLRAIVQKAQGTGAKVLLCGMLVPPSYGPVYQKSFSALFPRLARELRVAFSPFPLRDVAGRPGLNLADGIHPNPEGQRIVAAVVAKDLSPLLK